MAPKLKASFIEPMLLRAVPELPEDRASWRYELKMDGYRAVGFKLGSQVHLRSRNDNDFAQRYETVTKGLRNLPSETVIDGEVVALGEDGRPSFNLLQNHGSTPSRSLLLRVRCNDPGGKGVRNESLETRIELLEGRVLPKLSEPIRPCAELLADLDHLKRSVRDQGLEGLVAKRRDHL